MLDKIKGMFGGDIDPMAMLKPMLPGMLKQGRPQVIQAYQDKVNELSSQLKDFEFDEDSEYEIVPFGTVRNNEPAVQWVLLEHGDQVIIKEVLATYTLDEMFQGITGEPLELENEAPKELPPALQRRHDTYCIQRYLVIKSPGGKMEVIEGPAPEGETVYYGHHDEEICYNWAREANNQRL